MSRTEDTQSALPDFRVFLQDKHGRFLARSVDSWFFTDNRALAAVFYYAADHVPEQLERLRQTQSLDLEAVPVPLEEIYEICDRCKELFIPYMVLFDGTRFLCADCRSRMVHRPAPAIRSKAQ